VLAGYLLDGVRAGGEEGVGEVWDDETDEFGALALEEACGLILAVAELGDGGFYFFASGGADGGMVVDDPGDGHESYASELGNFSDCGGARRALRHGNQHNRRAVEGDKKRSTGVPFCASKLRRTGLLINRIILVPETILGGGVLCSGLAKGEAIAYPSLNNSSECMGLKIEWLKDLARKFRAMSTSQGQVWGVLLAFTNYIWTG